MFLLRGSSSPAVIHAMAFAEGTNLFRFGILLTRNLALRWPFLEDSRCVTVLRRTFAECKTLLSSGLAPDKELLSVLRWPSSPAYTRRSAQLLLKARLSRSPVECTTSYFCIIPFTSSYSRMALNFDEFQKVLATAQQADTVKSDLKRTVRKATNALEALQAALAEMEMMLADEYVATPKVRKARTPREATEATEGAAPKKPGRPKKTA
jgi:hypothetical protein